MCAVASETLQDLDLRGTTLRRSILRILSRLNPKRIVIASTAPISPSSRGASFVPAPGSDLNRSLSG